MFRIPQRAPRLRGKPRITHRANCELLETRQLLAASGVLIDDSAHLTLSFAQDGTDIAGQPSALFATLNQVADPGDWQQAILSAFQTWAAHTNADVGLVADQGQPFGTPGLARRDGRFGDVRIGAARLAPDVMAVSVPSNSTLSGSWVGDVLLNAEMTFESLEQVFAVALHEAGHVFGLSHSDDPASVMHLHGPAPSSELAASDVDRIWELYGTRVPDINDAEAANDGFDEATRLQPVRVPGHADGSGPTIVMGDIGGGGDRDVLLLETPSDYEGPVTVRLRTSGLSQLSARVSLYDADNNMLVQSESKFTEPDPALVVQMDDRDEWFYVVVEGVDNGVMSVGGYALTSVFDGLLAVDDSTIDQITDGRYRGVSPKRLRSYFEAGFDPLSSDDAHADDHLAGATELKTSPGFVRGARYEVVGSISDATDVDYYTFKSPASSDGTMIVSLTSLQVDRLIPLVTLFDNHANLLPTNVLVNGSGQMVVEATAVEPDRTYVLQVAARQPGVLLDTGKYQAAISFRANATELAELATGQLTSDSPHAGHGFYVAQPQLFHFLLEVGENDMEDDQAVQMSIVSTDLQLIVAAGDVRSSAGILLQPGTYTIGLRLATRGQPLAAGQHLAYRLRGTTVSDPFGVLPVDPLDEPLFECEGLDQQFCYPGGVISATPYYLGVTQPLLPNTLINVGTNDILTDWWQMEPAVVQNTAPSGQPESYAATQDQPLRIAPSEGVLANDVDAEHDLFVAVATVLPEHGTLELSSDGGFVYTPEPGFHGADQFQYVARDPYGDSSATTVHIDVAPSEPPSNLPGDANRDGVFDSSDLILIFQAGQYEDATESNSMWQTGDWNGDGEFDSSDLIVAFQLGHYESG